MSRLPAEQVRTLIDFLEAEGFLRTNPLHATLEPTPAAAKILFQGEKLSMPGAEGPGRGGAAGGAQKISRPLPRPGGGGPVLRPPGRPDPAGAGGERPGLCGVLQRHFGGHGGEGPPYDGRIFWT